MYLSQLRVQDTAALMWMSTDQLLCHKQRHNVATSQRRNVTTSQRHNVATSQRPNVATSQRPNVTTSQRHNVATSQYAACFDQSKLTCVWHMHITHRDVCMALYDRHVCNTALAMINMYDEC
jgi:hypothetical protein